MPRAVTTAKIISSKINLPFHTDTALREINNGNLSGMLNSEAEIKYPGLFFSSLKMDEHYPNGESPNEFYNRIKTWFHNFILQNADANSNILVVTHGGVIGIIYHLTNKIEWSNKQNNFKIPPGSIHILNIDTMQFE